MLPPDDSTEGFDNIADVLGTSPALIERYIGAAGKISRLAVGNTDLGPLSTTYKVRGDLSQDRHIEGLPLGTRGGILIRHNFPVDGEYLFKFSLLKVNFGPQYGGAAKGEQLEMSVNGERVKLHRSAIGAVLLHSRRGGRRRPGGSARSPAADESRTADRHRHLRQEERGVRRRSVPALRRDDGRSPDRRAIRVHHGAASVGRGNPRPVQRHRSRRHAEPRPDLRLPSACRAPTARTLPAGGSEKPACARKILSTLARRAFRRPVTDADLTPLLSFYRTGRESGDFDTRHRDGAAPDSHRSELRVPVRTGSGEPARRRRLSPDRRRACVASVVLPVEQHSRRRAPDRPPSRASSRIPPSCSGRSGGC